MAYKNIEDKKENARQYYINNREKIRKQQIEHHKNNYEKDIERIRKNNKKWYKNNRGKIMKKKYDLYYEDWLKLWELQDGKCAICEKPFEKPFDACIDHNHKTGKIRGLLCRKCNTGIGFFDDNPILTMRLTKYLNHC